TKSLVIRSSCANAQELEDFAVQNCGVRVRLPATNGLSQRCDAFPQVISQVGAALCYVFGEVAGGIFPIVEGFAGVVVTAAKIAAHLAAGFGGEEHSYYGSGAQAD